MNNTRILVAGLGVLLAGLAILSVTSGDPALPARVPLVNIVDTSDRGGALGSVDAGELRVGVPAGMSTWQDLRYSTVTTQRVAGRPAGSMRVEIVSRLVSAPRDSVGDHRVRRCRLVFERLRVLGFAGGDAAVFREDLRQGLEVGFLLAQDASGAAIAIRLPVGSPLPVLTVAVDVAKTITFPVVSEGPGRWSWDRRLAPCVERLEATRDWATEEFVAFVCRRASFAPLSVGGAALPTGALTAEVLWDRAAQWPAEVQCNEEQVWKMPGVGLELRKTLVLSTADPGADVAFPVEPEWQAAWQSLDCREAIEAAAARAAQGRALDDPRSALQMVHELLAAIQRGATAAEQRACLRDLLARLRAQPECALQLRSLLADHSLDERVFDEVLGVLARSGSDASEQVLLAVLEDASVSIDRQCLLIKNLFGRDEPAPRLVSALLKLRAGGQRDPEVDGMALLAAGALSRFPGEDESWERFVALRPRGTDGSSLALWLRAAANAGAERVWPLAREYLDHPTAGVRLAALDALRGNRSAAAIHALQQRVGDGSIAVRAKAVHLLAELCPDPGLPELEAVTRDEVAKVRLALVRGLAERRDEPAAWHLLQRLAIGDPDEAVRAAALRSMGRG